jgi:hypothetical protein
MEGQPEHLSFISYLKAGAAMNPEYDVNSAVTFFLLGLGIGALVALVCSPETRRLAGQDRISSGPIRKERIREKVERVA